MYSQASALDVDLPRYLQNQELGIVQRKELWELAGFESRNKYAIVLPSGEQVGFCAEQGKGVLAGLGRQFLGHWRAFTLQLFDEGRRPTMHAEHPFRFFFQELVVHHTSGQRLGSIVRRWSILTKAFDVLDAQGALLFRVRSPFWRIWTFRFERDGQEFAAVEKKWSGMLTEVFTDADRFRVTFHPSLSTSARALVLFAAVYIDLMYFERKASSETSLLSE